MTHPNESGAAAVARRALPLLDLTARVDDPAVVGVWSLAVYWPDERKIAERVALYRPPRACHALCHARVGPEKARMRGVGPKSGSERAIEG